MFRKSILLIVAFILVLSISGCRRNTDYVAISDFYYSSDAGKTYGNRTKEFSVGETVYMQVIVRVESNSRSAEEVTVVLTIPNITAVDAKYYDGQPITPEFDDINNVTRYTFTIIASRESNEWPFVFQFIPNSPDEITMKLEFDDRIPSLYDKQNTVKFIEGNTQDNNWED